MLNMVNGLASIGLLTVLTGFVYLVREAVLLLRTREVRRARLIDKTYALACETDRRVTCDARGLSRIKDQIKGHTMRLDKQKINVTAVWKNLDVISQRLEDIDKHIQALNN